MLKILGKEIDINSVEFIQNLIKVSRDVCDCINNESIDYKKGNQNIIAMILVSSIKQRIKLFRSYPIEVALCDMCISAMNKFQEVEATGMQGIMINQNILADLLKSYNKLAASALEEDNFLNYKDADVVHDYTPLSETVDRGLH